MPPEAKNQSLRPKGASKDPLSRSVYLIVSPCPRSSPSLPLRKSHRTAPGRIVARQPPNCNENKGIAQGYRISNSLWLSCSQVSPIRPSLSRVAKRCATLAGGAGLACPCACAPAGDNARLNPITAARTAVSPNAKTIAFIFAIPHLRNRRTGTAAAPRQSLWRTGRNTHHLQRDEAEILDDGNLPRK